ncbi:MAG: RIP metalloprotease RseP [Deltaproteobacteria bacterium]|nr:RIP metalloprotease RseP [Deltaproteobacteria bacterium]TFG60269.1 MAG: RIP metalloprotease RseP [Deltaproteobacteria bacterium]
MIYFLSFLAVLGILIFVHEFGHFIVARRLGVGVTKFSFGFGPKLAGFTRGETEYLISAIPLGGYVKLVGESDEEEVSPEERDRAFYGKPVWVKMAIVSAGPIANLVFAFLVFWVVFQGGVPALTPKVGDVMPDTPAARAGIEAGDLVVRIGEREITTWEELAAGIQESGAGKELAMTVRRGEKEIQVTVIPEIREGLSIFGEKIDGPKIGVVASKEVIHRKINPVAAIGRAAGETWRIITLTVLTVVKLVMRVLPSDTLGGPILIAQIAGDQARQGISPFAYFLGLLSVNLGILNLLPIPILDGGHLLFFSIEALRRKPLSPQVRMMAQHVGLAVILMLTALVFYNDIARLIAG